MPFDPTEFLQTARHIASGNASEGALRTCVGRAYYSVHLTAREHLGGQLRHKQVKKRGSHGSVIKAMKERDLNTGNKLDRLFQLRVEADYHLVPSDPEYVDWGKNWQAAEAIAADILPRVRRI